MGDENLRYRQNGRTLSYVCESSGSSLVKTHRISVSWKGWSLRHYVLLLIVGGLLWSLIAQSGAEFVWPVPILGTVVLIWERRRRVVEEVIVVMPTLGVQLVTVYYSKKVHRRFVPLQKIVAPVINEAVSPVTCYFYLALILRGEDTLVLTFLALRPPLKMLVPIWRSLGEAVGTSVAEPLASEKICNAGLNAEVETE